MTLGVSTYAYVWRRGTMDLPAMLADARALGCEAFQICDAPELESVDPAGPGGAVSLQEIARRADELGLRLETGTRGVEPAHLLRHLAIARALGAPLVRTMLASPRGTPSLDDAVEALREVMPAFEEAGVTLGLETYEQVASDDLVRTVRAVGSPRLGIVLDPGNSVARLEHPRDVIARTAPHVVNLHVKDFAFTRKEATVGFTLAGAPLGEGLLDYDAMCDALEAHGREVTHVVEHWLTRQDTLEDTRALEARWVSDAVTHLRRRARC